LNMFAFSSMFNLLYNDARPIYFPAAHPPRSFEHVLETVRFHEIQQFNIIKIFARCGFLRLAATLIT
jgi:hypothetical protein